MKLDFPEPKKEVKEMRTLTIKVDLDVYEDIEDIAREKGLSKTKVATVMFMAAFKEYKK